MMKRFLFLYSIGLIFSMVGCRKEIHTDSGMAALTFYGDAWNSRVIKVIPLKDEGFLLVGEWSEGGYFFQNRKDGWLVRIDKDGKEIFNKKFGRIRQDVLTSAVELPDGAIVACGYTASIGVNATGTQYTDGWILKVDKSGTEIWSKSVPGGMTGPHLKGIYSEEFHDIALTADQTFLVCGLSSSYLDTGKASHPSLPHGAWLAEVDADGNYLWETAYKTTSNYDNDRFKSIVLKGDEIYCAFSSASPTGGRSPAHGFIRWKKNAKGILPDFVTKGVHEFPGLLTHDAESSCIVLLDNGDVAMGGYEPEKPDIPYLVKFNKNGTELSFTYLEIEPLGTVNGFVKSPGGFYFIGEFRKSYADPSAAMLISTDKDGKIVWWKQYRGNGNVSGKYLFGQLQGMKLFGNIFNMNSGSYDAFMMKLNEKGEVAP